MSTEAGSTKRGNLLLVKLRLLFTRDDELFPVRGAPKRVLVEALRCKTISRRQRVRLRAIPSQLNRVYGYGVRGQAAGKPGEVYGWKHPGTGPGFLQDNPNHRPIGRLFHIESLLSHPQGGSGRARLALEHAKPASSLAMARAEA